MTLTYVIPDIHGRYDLLNEGLAAITARGDGGVIVMIGDYVDKGRPGIVNRSSTGCCQALPKAGSGGAKGQSRRHDGGGRCAIPQGRWRRGLPRAAMPRWPPTVALIPPTCRKPTLTYKLDQLRLMHVDAHRIYVHAGVDPEISLDRQSEATLLWKRYPKGFPGGFGDRHVVHGHDNFPEGPLLYEGPHQPRYARVADGTSDDRGFRGRQSGRSRRFHRDQGISGGALVGPRWPPYWGFRFVVLGMWISGWNFAKGLRHHRRERAERCLKYWQEYWSYGLPIIRL